jgi:hypothetical protein
VPSLSCREPTRLADAGPRPDTADLDRPAGQPPGEDVCDSALLVFDDASPSPPLFDEPRRIELRGLWADSRPSGLGFGARGLEIYPVQASF